MFISWKLINGLKKIEKAIFPVGKIQEKKSFSTAKEKLFILQLFWTNVVFNWRKGDLTWLWCCYFLTNVVNNNIIILMIYALILLLPNGDVELVYKNRC